MASEPNNAHKVPPLEASSSSLVECRTHLPCVPNSAYFYVPSQLYSPRFQICDYNSYFTNDRNPEYPTFAMHPLKEG